MTIVFEHALPVWMLAVLLAAALATACAAYAGAGATLSTWQRHALRAVRAAALGVLVGCWLQPVRLDRTASRQDAAVPILIDVSRSMSLAHLGGEPRLARARDLVSGRLLPALDRRFRAEVLSFGDTLANASLNRLEPRARRSDLVGALGEVRERYAGRALAGVVVVSDGGLTGRARPDLPALDVPVFTVSLGASAVARDREVASVTLGDASLAGSTVDLAAAVVSRGFGRAPLSVTLRENGRPLQVQSVEPAEDGTPVAVVFPVSPPAEVPTVYTVEVAHDAAEVTGENNARSVVAGPAGRRRRVLLVEGAPGFEHSFLKRALEADPALEVDALVRKGQNDRGADTYYVQAAASRAARLLAGYPTSREALFEYDALVFANVGAEVFTREQLALTADFVGERGGGLLVLGARSFEHQSWLRTPVENLLPVELADRSGLALRASVGPAADRFHLLPTPDGLGHPILRVGMTGEETRRRWAAAPALASAAALGGPKPGATVLAEVLGDGGMTRPLLAVQRYGEGRTMVFTGEAAWRWKMLQPSEDRLYDTFWRQALRWLVIGAPDRVSLEVPATVTPGEVVPLGITVRDAAFAPVADAAVRVRVEAPGEAARELTARPVDGQPGRYEAFVTAGDAGVHRLEAEAQRGGETLGSAARVVLAGGADEEFADPRVNEAVLRRVAEATGGEFVDPEAPEAIDAMIEALAARVVDESLPVRRELWHSVWTFLAVVVFLSVEWTLRRRWGLR